MAVFTDMSSLHEENPHGLSGTGGLDAPGTLLKGTSAVLGKRPGSSPDTSLLCTEKASIPRPPSYSQSQRCNQYFLFNPTLNLLNCFY